MKHILGGRDADMTHGNIMRQIISFSLPMALGLLFQQMYNTVDTIVVGRFVSYQALAAVGTTGSIVNMLVGFSAGLSTGAGVVISQAYGAHDQERLDKAVHTSLAITLILCVILTVLGLVIIDPMLRFMQIPDDVWNEAKEYLTIYFAGLTALLLYNMGSAILRAVGDSSRPLIILIVASVVNVFGDLLFVVHFRIGVAGAAYATVMSQGASAVMVLWILSRVKEGYGIRWKRIRIDPSSVKSIMMIGLPSGLQQAVTAFSNVFVQSYTNYFGSAAMAGWASYNKLDSYLSIPVQSIAMASSTFVGQNAGANDMERAKKGTRTSLIMGLVVTVALSALIMLLARPAISLFTSEEEVIEYGVFYVRLISPFFVTLVFNQVYAGALRGIGNSLTPMLVMLGSFVVFRQIYLATVKALGNALVPISLAYPMGWIMCSVLISISYHRSILGKKKTDNA